MTDVAGEAALLPTPGRTPRRLILILASLAFVVVAAAASLIIVQGVGSQMDDIRRTQESARLARDLIQALTDAETGQRGYLLTQDEFYLDPYRAAVTTIDETFNGIVAAVGDKPQQASRVQSLSELIEQNAPRWQRPSNSRGRAGLPKRSRS
jgi:CHASE3 domain sensor protein